MGMRDAEAGGPQQRERAEREWSREPRETRERVEREQADQQRERERAAEQARARAAAEQQARESAAAEQRRQQIEAETARVLEEAGRKLIVTDRYRANSAAHRRGAIDISSKDLETAERQAEAQRISGRLGADHTVVVEEVHRPEQDAEGPSGQINTSYREGEPLNRHVDPITATGTHTHVQPDPPRKP